MFWHIVNIGDKKMSTSNYTSNPTSKSRHTDNRSQWLTSLLIIFLGFIFISASGCSSTDSTGSSADNGEVIIGLTDAEGDNASYTVDVLSLTLTKANGVIVETLPLNTTIDFAQYTELTEFLTAATVPSGVYTKASMVLDYSNADIQVEDPDGNIIPVTTIIDIDGNPIDTLEVSVQLEDRDKLLIAPGIPAHLTLDFDLKASNRVDFSGIEPILTVAPFLVADVELNNPKPHRLRGPLASVDVEDESFNIIVRPFRHLIAHNDRRFGTINVHVDKETVYEINGISFEGESGLEELNVQNTFTAVIAMGDLKFSNGHRVFVATQVYAGSSVPNGGDDVVRGHVIARNGDTLELKGATLLRADGSVVFNDAVTIELAATTAVTKQLSTNSHDISEISVGQHLTVFGKISGDAINGFTLDASNGKARMLLTTVNGSIVQTDSPLAVDVNNIARRAVGTFDFSGTGANEADDADPAFYEIYTSTLDLSGLVVNEPVKVRGFVRAFGLAPEDFDAQSLVLVAQAKALMMVNWEPATNTAISEITENQIALDLTGTGRFHHIVRANVLTDLSDFASNPVLIPNESAEGVFVIVRQHSAQVFLNFSQFSRALADHLGNSASVKIIRAKGHFNDDNVTMTVRGIRVVLR
jgi:hypothetical protein